MQRKRGYSASVAYWTETVTNTDADKPLPPSPLSPTTSHATIDTRNSAASVSGFSTTTNETEITVPGSLTHERSSSSHPGANSGEPNGFRAPWKAVEEYELNSRARHQSTMSSSKSEDSSRGIFGKLGGRKKPSALDLSKENLEMQDLSRSRSRTATATASVTSPTSMSFAQLDIYAAQLRQPVAAQPVPDSADGPFFRRPRAMPSMPKLYAKQHTQTEGAVKLRVKTPAQTGTAPSSGASTSSIAPAELDAQSVYTTITTSSAGSTSTRSTVPMYGRGGAARAAAKEPKTVQIRKFGSQKSLMSEIKPAAPDLTPGKTGGKAFIEGLFKPKPKADKKGKGRADPAIAEQVTKEGWRPPHVGHDTVSMLARGSNDTLNTFSSSKSKERVYTYGRGGAGKMAKPSEAGFTPDASSLKLTGSQVRHQASL